MNSKLAFFVLAALVSVVHETSGHGYMLDPVNRASRWRVDGSTPRDYNDMESFCGGYAVQWNQNGGKCGHCGDRYNDPMPRMHELGGAMGQGVVVKTYSSGSTIPVNVKLTANHMGYFYFKLCNLDAERESDACFERNKIYTSAGTETYTLPSSSPGEFRINLQLPSGLRCNHCVLQWTYVAGNNWGWCPDGSGRLGCGPQEHFRNCADIKIV